MKNTNQARVNFRFQKTLLNHLRIASKIEAKSMSVIVRESVGKYLDDFYKNKKTEIEKKREIFKNIDDNFVEVDYWDSDDFVRSF